MATKHLLLMSCTLALLLPMSPTGYADPPPWAPAHGWRKKHDPYYTGYSGKKWSKDYGIINGKCHWQEVGTVIGGVIGGAVGASVSKKENRVIAIIIGGAIGSILGSQIGKTIDNNDRGCIGHALELGADHQTISWENPGTGLNYHVTPIGGFNQGGRKCREYDFTITGDDIHESRQEKACRSHNGTWIPL